MESNIERWQGADADPRGERALSTIRRWKRILDEAFGIPGTKFRFGWDPILGLNPGLGDILTGIASVILLIQAFRLRVPPIIKARMLLNVIIDVVVGTIPLIGDIFDFAWKSTSLNLVLLEKHAGTGAKPGVADWAFVLCTVAAVLIILAIPVLLLLFLFSSLFSRIHGPSLWNI
jgi:hypothetical protein